MGGVVNYIKNFIYIFVESFRRRMVRAYSRAAKK